MRRRAPSKTLRSYRFTITGDGGRGRGRDAERSAATAAAATPSAVRATAATAGDQRTRVGALAVATLVWHQECGRLAIALSHRRHPQLPVSVDAVVGLATTTLRRDDLATILAPHQFEVCPLSTHGQHTPAATGTPVHPQLAIPAGAGDSATAALSFLLPLSVIMEPATEIGNRNCPDTFLSR